MEIIENLTVILISFSIGTFLGGLYVFLAFRKTSESMEEELNVKSDLLQKLQNKIHETNKKI
mgnify:CR=1 FL=1